MSKISVEYKRGKTLIKNKLTYPEAVNERVYNAMVSGLFEGFLPIMIYQKKKETAVECTAQGLMPLSQYFNGIVTKKMFLDFVHEIAMQIKICEKNMINPNNLELQNDKIFVDPVTKSVKCVFWPVVNNQRDKSPHLFLKQLPFELNFDPSEDTDYLDTYKAFFQGVNPFSVNNFDRMVLKLSGKKVGSGHIAPSEALSGTLSGNDKNNKKEMNTMKQTNIEYNPFAQDIETPTTVNSTIDSQPQKEHIFCSSCGAKNKITSNFCLKCGTKLKNEMVIKHNAQQPVVVQAPVVVEKPTVVEPAPVVVDTPPVAPAPVAEPQPVATPVSTVVKVRPVVVQPSVLEEQPVVSEPEVEAESPVVPEPIIEEAPVVVPEPVVEEQQEEQPVYGGTTVLGADYGGTTVLGYDDPEVPVYPTLTRIKTEETFSVDKPSYRIGKEKQYCDLFISDNNYISRSHADIVTRDNRYYIIDRNSTNKSYVDGKVIPAENEIEIFSGTKIRLANEDFIFNIES